MKIIYDMLLILFLSVAMIGIGLFTYWLVVMAGANRKMSKEWKKEVDRKDREWKEAHHLNYHI